MRPLLLLGVLYVFFAKVAHVNKEKGPGAAFYGAQLLGSIVLFTFFAEATMGAVASVVDRENLVRKIQFPRMVIPLSVVLTAFFNFCASFLAAFIFMIAQGVAITWHWLWLLPPAAIPAFFCTALAKLIS